MSEETQLPFMERIQKESADDLSFDLENADTSSLQLSRIRQKWCTYAVRAELSRKKSEQEKKQKYRTLHEFYMKEYNLKIDRRDVDSYIEGDLEYQRLEASEEYWKQCSKFVDGILQCLDKATWNISNAIKWHAFKAGAN